LNIGLKSAETPVITGLQALIYDILTGTEVPVKTAQRSAQNHWHCCIRTTFAKKFKVALPGPNRSQT